MKIYEWRSDLISAQILPSAKLVGLVISEFYRDGKDCYPSISTIGELCGYGSNNTVLQGIEILKNEGFISVEKRRFAGRARPSNVYCFDGVMSNSAPSPEPSAEPSPEPSRSALEITKTTEVTKVTKDKPKKEFSAECVSICSLLRSNLEEKLNRKFTVTAKWKEDVDKINRLDGISFERIEKVIKWHFDNYDRDYRHEIQSAESLRKKFSAVEQSMNATVEKKRERIKW